MRLASLEWVSENIVAFGGDPKKITIWVRALNDQGLHRAYFHKGQSAGSTSVDYQNFAFPSNPIAAGFLMSSGTALLPNIATSDRLHSNFTFVASHLGCGGLNASEEVSCMRKVSVADIENFVGQYQDNSSLFDISQPPIRFTPVPDEVLVFSNYTERYAKGAFSERPAIISSTADEGTLLVPVPDDPIMTSANQTLANAITVGIFVCPAAESSVLRTRHGLTTYRSQFAGNFSNVSPLWWLGAYHTSDLQMLFGKYQDYVGLGGQGRTALEIATSNVMQDFVLAFMKDPVHGPPNMGWPTFANGGMLRFGADGKAVQNVSINAVDGVCYNQSSYDYNP
jgi:carboxylesterase type B